MLCCVLRGVSFVLIAAGAFAQTGPAWRQPPQKRYVAVIGASDYARDTPWQVLQAATKDAAAVATLFGVRMGYEVVLPSLLDPTEPSLRAWLGALPQKVGDADELIVFITGHGTNSGQFVSVDGHLVPVSEILESLFRLSARRLLVIQHFCYSADRGQVTLPPVQPGLVREVIASGRAQVYNDTDKSVDYSPFTLGLLDYFDARLTNYTIERQVNAAGLAATLANSEPDPGRKAMLLNPPGESAGDFIFDLDGRETDIFRRAVKQPGTGGAALRDYLDHFAHGIYEREAWALIENIEKEKRESKNLDHYRGSLRGGEAGDKWLNLRGGPETSLPYVWVPATTVIATGHERLELEKLASETRGFWMTQTEVPVSAYKRRAERMPRAPGFDRGWKEDNEQQPMVNVSLADARAFCAKEGGRLPTGAEWEYAARAQDEGDSFGHDRPIGFANLRGKHCPGSTEPCEFYDHYENAAPVDKMLRDVNGWLLIGMAGNVSEITDDIEKQTKDGEPVANMSASGANFADPATAISYSLRRTVYAGGANTVGFRCVIPYGM